MGLHRIVTALRAHIGVIKAMEEAGLYPDYITGTSMGSIIGADPRRLGFSGKLSYYSLIGAITFGTGKDQYLSGIYGFFGVGYYIKSK